jgi:hypothetical protein
VQASVMVGCYDLHDSVHVLTYARYSLTVHAKDDVRHCRHGLSRTWYERPGAPPPVCRKISPRSIKSAWGQAAQHARNYLKAAKAQHKVSNEPPPGGGGVADRVQAR